MNDRRRRSCSAMSMDYQLSHRDSSALPSYLEEDKYYRCCCGVHVHMGTFIISVIFIIQWIGTVVPFLSASRWEYLTLILPAITCLPPILLLIGNRKHFPSLYWPHILLQGTVFTMILLTAIAFLSLAFITMVSGTPKELKRSRQLYKFFRQLSAFSIALIGLGFVLLSYCWFYLLHVVYRGYRFLQEALYYD